LKKRINRRIKTSGGWWISIGSGFSFTSRVKKSRKYNGLDALRRTVLGSLIKKLKPDWSRGKGDGESSVRVQKGGAQGNWWTSLRIQSLGGAQKGRKKVNRTGGREACLSEDAVILNICFVSRRRGEEASVNVLGKPSES